MAGKKGRSGGFRIGAGRKRRDPTAAWLGGYAGKRRGIHAPHSPGRPTGLPPAPPPTPDPVEMPVDLAADVKAVWEELAPFATAERTLTPASSLAFGILCRNIVLERMLATGKLTPAGADHRGMLQRVETGLARFRLIPDGRPVVALEAPKDEWAEFETGPRLVQSS